jgi:ABC-type microcin C transport system permease subunit YejE
LKTAVCALYKKVLIVNQNRYQENLINFNQKPTKPTRLNEKTDLTYDNETDDLQTYGK